MNDLILAQSNGLFAGLTPHAQAIKDLFLERAAVLPIEPKTKDEHDASFAVSSDLEQWLKDVEKARVTGKEPALKECQRIDKAFSEFREELESELNRLRLGEGNYQQIQQTKFKDAVQAQNGKYDELDQKRFKALSEAKTEDERDLISMDFHNQRQALEAQAPKQNLAPGQRVAMDWDITVDDPVALVRAYGLQCADIRPRIIEIKALLNSGIENIPGVKAELKAKSASARGRKKPIDV